jgi:predicted RND superfamily exporter protein
LKTWKATLTAALAAGLSYGSLMLTSFRGFRQFGMIGLIGMALSWLSAYTLLPALLAVGRRRERLRTVERRVGPGVRRPRQAFVTGLISDWIVRMPRTISIVSLGLTALAVASIAHSRPGLLETNLEHLRSRRSTQNGAAYYTRYLNEIFQRFLTPIAVMPTSHEKAIEISRRLKELKRKQGQQTAIVSVQTIDDFVPEHQDEKIAILKEIRAQLKPRVLARLAPEDRMRAQEFLEPEIFHEFTVKDLPPLVVGKFTEKDGSLGNLVLVEPPLSKDIWNGNNLEAFIESLRSVTDSVDPGAPVAGGMAITADLISSIARDGPRATLMAFLAVVGLVILLFRDPRTIAWALLALLVGVAWFGGIVVKLSDYGLKINFLNFVALPITFGIGVDYGVNVFQRWRERRGDGIAQIIRETGGAVALSSLTTIIGYSSLLMASNQGFISFGLLAVLGEMTCVSAALIALPAVLTWKAGAAARRSAGRPAAKQP